MKTTQIREQIYEFIKLYVDTPEPKKLCSSIEDLVDELAEIKVKNLALPNVMHSVFTILNKGEIVENILFKSQEEARNWIKMKYPKRRFKEPQENVFVCNQYGTKFIIQEQHYR